MADNNEEQKNSESGKSRPHQSLISKITHGLMDGGVKTAKNVKNSFFSFGNHFSTALMHGVGKVATSFGISTNLAIVILSSIFGSGVLAFFGISASVRNDAGIKSEEVWVCDQDELDVRNTSTSEDDIQEMVNIMYAYICDELGYSQEFLVGMLSCMGVECSLHPGTIEHINNSSATADFHNTNGGFWDGEIIEIDGEQDVQLLLDSLGQYTDISGYTYPTTYNSGYYVDPDATKDAFLARTGMSYNYDRAVGIGMIQWTGPRAVEFCSALQLTNDAGMEYHWYDIQYQMAYFFAENGINDDSSALNDDSLWSGSDAECTKNFFKTYVSGGSLSDVDKRLAFNTECRQYVDAAAANAEFNEDITSMAEIIMDEDMTAQGKHNADLVICTNKGAFSTDDIALAALSVAWLEKGDFVDDDAARHAGVEANARSVYAPKMINDWDFRDGKADNPGGSKLDLIACTEYYYLAHRIVIPNETGYNGNDGYFSSCDRGTCTPIRMSGHDDDFPAGAPDGQRNYAFGTERYGGKKEDTPHWLWDEYGYIYDGYFYTYGGNTALPSGAILISGGSEDFVPMTAVDRFADVADGVNNNTGNHIITYVGESAVRKWYGEDFLLRQCKLFSDCQCLLHGDYTIEPDSEMDDALKFKRKYASKTNDKFETFISMNGDTALSYTDKDDGSSVQPDHIINWKDADNGDNKNTNQKTGLRWFYTMKEIETKIDDATKSASGAQSNGLEDWMITLLAETEYHQQQMERYLRSTQILSYPVEEDAIIDTEGDGYHYNAYIVRVPGKFYGDQVKYPTIVSNDMLQDLLQEDVNSVNSPTEYVYGLTIEDYKELIKHPTIKEGEDIYDSLEDWSKEYNEQYYNLSGGINGNDQYYVKWGGVSDSDWDDIIDYYNKHYHKSAHNNPVRTAYVQIDMNDDGNFTSGKSTTTDTSYGVDAYFTRSVDETDNSGNSDTTVPGSPVWSGGSGLSSYVSRYVSDLNSYASKNNTKKSYSYKVMADGSGYEIEVTDTSKTPATTSSLGKYSFGSGFSTFNSSIMGSDGSVYKYIYNLTDAQGNPKKNPARAMGGSPKSDTVSTTKEISNTTDTSDPRKDVTTIVSEITNVTTYSYYAEDGTTLLATVTKTTVDTRTEVKTINYKFTLDGKWDDVDTSVYGGFNFTDDVYYRLAYPDHTTAFSGKDDGKDFSYIPDPVTTNKRYWLDEDAVTIPHDPESSGTWSGKYKIGMRFQIDDALDIATFNCSDTATGDVTIEIHFDEHGYIVDNWTTYGVGPYHGHSYRFYDAEGEIIGDDAGATAGYPATPVDHDGNALPADSERYYVDDTYHILIDGWYDLAPYKEKILVADDYEIVAADGNGGTGSDEQSREGTSKTVSGDDPSSLTDDELTDKITVLGSSGGLVSYVAGGNHVWHVKAYGTDHDESLDKDLAPGGDYAFWVCHASRGDRGVKCQYLDFAFFKGVKRRQYYIFTSTPNNDSNPDDDIDDSTIGSSKYKKLIDIWNQNHEHSRNVNVEDTVD